MLIKYLLRVFERAKSKFIDSDRPPSNAVITEEQSTAAAAAASGVFLAKWLCNTPNKSLIRRSSSWRSVKERSHLPSRTRSVDELDRKASKQRPARKNRFDRLIVNPGYSEESWPSARRRRPLHTSCPHCHCEQHSSFSTYPQSVKDLSTSDVNIVDKPALSTSRSYPHLLLSPSSSGSRRIRPRRAKNSHVFGELNLAAIERDSLRSSSGIERSTFLVWHEYQDTSLLSPRETKRIFSVARGDQVRLLRRIGRATLLVQKEDDGTVGFLPQACLADDQIQSFLAVKGLRETVL